MKTKLVKSMPHVPLHKLKLIPELKEEISLNPDEEQDNGESNDEVEDVSFSFECSDQQGEPKQHKVLGVRNRIRDIFRKIFKKTVITRYEINSGSEGMNYCDLQLTKYNNSENGESDSEEDFHDETPLIKRTLRI